MLWKKIRTALLDQLNIHIVLCTYKQGTKAHSPHLPPLQVSGIQKDMVAGALCSSSFQLAGMAIEGPFMVEFSQW